MVSELFKLEPLYWTMATFGGVGGVTQFADRFPSRYVKFTGKRLGDPLLFCSKHFDACDEVVVRDRLLEVRASLLTDILII